MRLNSNRLPRAGAIVACANKALARDCLLAGGDDYELVFTAPPSKRSEIEAAARATGVSVAVNGATVAGKPGVRLRDARGKTVANRRAGFDHFA